MSAKTLGYIEEAEPVHVYAKTELAPIINGKWSFFGGLVELFESDRKLGDRMTQEMTLTFQLAEKMQQRFSPIEIYSYQLYLKMLLREQDIYQGQLGWWTAFLSVPFLVGFLTLSDIQSVILLMITLLVVISMILSLVYRFGRVNNFARRLKLACEFVEINEKRQTK